MLIPTTTDPSADTPLALLVEKLPPGKYPSPTIPVCCVQRNASPDNKSPNTLMLIPTTTDPSPDIPAAELEKTPPGKYPSPTIPVCCVQRNASPPLSEAVPTTTDPSADTPVALLEKLPGKPPNP